MNLMILKTTYWQGRALHPGTVVGVADRLLALAMVGSQRAVAADPETAAMLDTAPAARAAATPTGRAVWRR